MKKQFLLFLSLILGLMSCNSKLTVEQAETAVLQGENDNLPLLVQKFSDVESIVIDSIYIRVVDEPMSGYLYTTWKYVVRKTMYPTIDEIKRGIHERRYNEEQREKQVIVEVSGIQHSKEYKGYIEWQTGWKDAYRVILNDRY